MARLLLATALVLVALVAVVGVAGADGPIEGVVVNKTGGERGVSGQEVELQLVRADGGVESTLAAKTDGQGKFSFASVSTSSPLTYTVSTQFQGVEYQATLNVTQTGAAAKAELAVYDTATDVDIQAELSHVIIDVDPQTRDLTVMEVAIVSNTTDRTLVARPKDQQGGGRSLWFPLPSGALHPEVGEGLDRVPVTDGADGLAYSGPVLPGKRQVVYSYMLANPGPSFTISKALSYPTGRVNVIMADVGQKVSGPKLAAKESVNIKDKGYIFMSGESFGAGESLGLEVANFPGPSTGGQGLSSSGQGRWLVLGLLGVLGLGLLAYARSRGSRPVALAMPARQALNLEREREELLVAIAELDGRFEAGEIASEQYQQQREARKRRLREIWNATQG